MGVEALGNEAVFQLGVGRIVPQIFVLPRVPLEVEQFTDAFAMINGQLVLACAMLPLVFLLRGVLLFINGYFLAAVGLRVVESIRLQAFSRLQCLSLSFHQSHREGDLISRIIADTAMLHVVDAGSMDAMSTGMRVKARWAEERVGYMTDIVCFEPEA